jgi:hypothetical protein
MAPLQTVARLLKRENCYRELLSDPDVSRAIKTIVPWRPIDVVVTATTAVDSTPAYSNSKCDSKSDSSSSSASTATSTEDRTDSAMQCSTNSSSSSSMMKSQLELQQEAQAKEDARARVIAKHALQSTGSSTVTNASTMQGTSTHS